MITRELWIERFVGHLRKRSGCDAQFARQTAEAQLENLGEDLTEKPEDVADDEMSYWTND
jgi:hypothetical protein